MERAVFLDRDGVINEIACFPELGLLDSPLNPDQFKLLPGVTEAVRGFNELGIKVIVVSNQPPIGKGKTTWFLFEEMRKKMRMELQLHGAHLDGEYYCFHHPKAKLAEYRAICECRKPEPGLILKAAKDFNLDLSGCYLVGDSLTDIEAGRRAGCTTLLIGKMKCDLCRYMTELGIRPDFVAPSLLHAFKVIEREVKERWRYSLTQQV